MKLIEKQKLKLNIRKQGINGEGIGYFNRIAVFVPGAIRKEVVNVEVVQVFDNYAIAKIIDIERESKKRVLPPCKFYEECGNCDLQHIEYKEQLKIKQLILEQSFKRYTSLNDVKSRIALTLTNLQNYHYRNYQEMIVKNTNFGVALGYFKPMTNHFVYIDDCMVNDPEINQISQLCLKLFRRHKLKAYDLRNKEGILYNLVIRYFKDTDSASVVMVVKEKDKVLETIAHELIQTFKSIKSVSYSIYNPDSKQIIYNPVEHLAGQEFIESTYHGLDVSVSANGTFPNNLSVHELMNELILKHSGLSYDDTIINLYDLSTISSLYFARYVKKVYAIDYSEASIKDGFKNMKDLGVQNIELIKDHVEGALPKLFKGKEKIDSVILNVPKYGLSKTSRDLMSKYKPNQVIYLSENPSTLAKDIDQLMNEYQVSKIIPVDLYPQTSRIDSITILERK
ncbi:23S rRNA (uracil(1939)-C(5))-methyltransferase RlmD [Mycoplasmatota bacterium]|nr:23S rRNA (uracil(1939)-C(5))-methyltransferase RlmD [Mycoplasmatota bacterium]